MWGALVCLNHWKKVPWTQWLHSNESSPSSATRSLISRSQHHLRERETCQEKLAWATSATVLCCATAFQKPSGARDTTFSFSKRDPVLSINYISLCCFLVLINLTFCGIVTTSHCSIHQRWVSHTVMPPADLPAWRWGVREGGGINKWTELC